MDTVGLATGPAETRVVHAVCSHDCPDSCGVLVTVESLVASDGLVTERAVKVQGDPSHPVTRGFLCGKVAKYLDRVYSPDRLLYPMRRKKGVAKGPAGYAGARSHGAASQRAGENDGIGHEADAFERIGWDEALDEIAARLKAIAAEFGPESILPYSYAGTIGQLGFGSMDRRFFHRLGASQLDRTICSEAGGVALKSVYGIKLGTRPEDFAHAGMVIAWGANIHGNNVHLWPFIEEARRNGARLVVIDPYKTRTAALADQHLAIRPGTDTMLALAMMHVIFREGLEDSAYLAECTRGAQELRGHALQERHSPGQAAEVTGIATESVVALARAYARCQRQTGRPAVIRLNYGIQRSENGGTAVRAVCMLPLLTGSWKARGGGLQLSTSGAFPFNTNALQMPELMLRSPLGRPSRVVNMSLLGEALTQLGTSGREAEGPPVKAVFCYNSNPAAVAPNQNAVLRGLMREDLFTVVHEQFFTDTADYADVLLPAPTFLEVKDVQGAYGHLFAQISHRAIAPLGEARSNVRLFGELARRMRFDEPCFNDGDDELIDQALQPAGSPIASWFDGITRERLEREGHIPLALPLDAEGTALPFSTADWFLTPSGRGELTPVPEYVAPAESRGGSAARNGPGKALYTLEFLPRKADNYMNSTFANIPRHRRMEARTAGVLEMHPEDATQRGLATGDAVEVFNARGRIDLRAQVGAMVPQGVVAARLDWNKLSGLKGEGGPNVNALTSERLTDIGGGATFYSTLVEVRRASVSFE
jgi:anaerobic selenocysteine-containing dehydrogenase